MIRPSSGAAFLFPEGGPMTRDQMARIALRYDTTMARAMLRALGVPVPHGVPRRGTIARVDRYDGALECMAQRHGVVL